MARKRPPESVGSRTLTLAPTESASSWARALPSSRTDSSVALVMPEKRPMPSPTSSKRAMSMGTRTAKVSFTRTCFTTRPDASRAPMPTSALPLTSPPVMETVATPASAACPCAQMPRPRLPFTAHDSMEARVSAPSSSTPTFSLPSMVTFVSVTCAPSLATSPEPAESEVPCCCARRPPSRCAYAPLRRRPTAL